MKSFKKYLIEKKDIPKEKRTLANKPKGIPPGEWLGCTNGGKPAYNGKYYGWSHRAIAGFKKGDKISGDSMAHKDYKWNDDEKGIKHSSYIIKTDQEAKEHAIRFMKNIS